MREGVEAAHQKNTCNDRKRVQSGHKEAELWETSNPSFPNISLYNLHILYTHFSFLPELIN